MKLVDFLAEQHDTDPFEEKTNVDTLPLEQQLKHWTNIERHISNVIDAEVAATARWCRSHGLYDLWDEVVTANPSRFQKMELPNGGFIERTYPSAEMAYDKTSRTPFSAITAHIDKAAGHLQHYTNQRYRAQNIARGIKRQMRSAVARKTAEQKTGIKAGTVKMIPEDKIPHKLSTTGKGGFDNPYFFGKVDRYAGDPDYYPWSNQMGVQYSVLSKILEEHGIAPFTVVYGSTKVHQRRTWEGSKAKGTDHVNFAVVAGNGKLIWRKYDPSPGAGQNWLIIAGNKINTSTLLAQTSAEQEQTLGPAR